MASIRLPDPLRRPVRLAPPNSRFGQDHFRITLYSGGDRIEKRHQYRLRVMVGRWFCVSGESTKHSQKFTAALIAMLIRIGEISCTVSR